MERVIVLGRGAAARPSASSRDGAYNELKGYTENTVRFWGKVAYDNYRLIKAGGTLGIGLAARILNSEGDGKEKSASNNEKKVRNPNGAKGKPDHQAKVKELEEKARAENPDKDVVTEKKIKKEGSNRRPDVQVVNPETQETERIYEAERKPNSARNKKREAEYERLKIPNETHPLGQ